MAWRRTGDEVVILDIKASRYFGLNPSAARLWFALQDGATRAELVTGLMSGQPVDAEQAGGDVEAFLGALNDRRLIDQV